MGIPSLLKDFLRRNEATHNHVVQGPYRRIKADFRKDLRKLLRNVSRYAQKGSLRKKASDHGCGLNMIHAKRMSILRRWFFHKCFAVKDPLGYLGSSNIDKCNQ